MSAAQTIRNAISSMATMSKLPPPRRNTVRRGRESRSQARNPESGSEPIGSIGLTDALGGNRGGGDMWFWIVVAVAAVAVYGLVRWRGRGGGGPRSSTRRRVIFWGVGPTRATSTG